MAKGIRDRKTLNHPADCPVDRKVPDNFSMKITRRRVNGTTVAAFQTG